MASVLKVDTIQLSDGSTPTAGDLGVDSGIEFNITTGMNSNSRNTKNKVLGPVTYNLATTKTTDTIDVSSYVTGNTIALVLHVWDFATTDGNYGHYWSFDAYQSGEATKQASFESSLYSTYYTNRTTTLFVPWDKNNSSTDLVVDTVYSYNSASGNYYELIVAGTVEAA